MLSAKWSGFWALVGALAGLVGAAAAIYPLMRQQQENIAHVEFGSAEFQVRADGVVYRPSNLSSQVGVLVVNTFSEPIILTGAVRINKLQIKKGIDFAHKDAKVSIDTADLQGKRLTPNTKTRIILMNWFEIENLRARNERLQCFDTCPTAAGSFDVELEVRSKNGLAWLSVPVEFCLRRDFPWYGGGC